QAPRLPFGVRALPELAPMTDQSTVTTPWRRELADLQPGLTAWAEARRDRGATVSEVRSPAGGMANDTVLFELDGEGMVARPAPRDGVDQRARRAAPGRGRQCRPRVPASGCARRHRTGPAARVPAAVLRVGARRRSDTGRGARVRRARADDAGNPPQRPQLG